MKQIILLLVVVVGAFGQSHPNNLLKTLENVSSCLPSGTDTTEALYRHTIDAYTDKISVQQGDSLGIFVGTKDSALTGTTDTIKIYRYGLNGWELKTTVGTYPLVYHSFHIGLDGQPTDYKYGAQWSKTVSVRINPAWRSGFYSAQMTATKNGNIYHGAFPFVVKPSNPGSTSSILWVVPTNTYQAYNIWGGSGLYWTSLPGAIYRTDTVSFDRPFGDGWTDTGFTGYKLNDSLGQFDEREWSWAKWLDTTYPVEYCSDYDIDQIGLSVPANFLSNYRQIIFPGHSEYWTQNMRAKIEDFVQNPNLSQHGGGSIAFFAANNCYWFASYPPGSNGRKIVVDKCTGDGYGVSAGLWRSVAHGSNHEAKFIGAEFRDSSQRANRKQFVVKPQHWIFQQSGITAVGDSFGFGHYCECPEYLDPVAAGESDDTVNGFTPINTQVLARVNDTNYFHPTSPLYSSVTYYIDHTGNGRVFAGAGHGWGNALLGDDSMVVRKIVSNIFDHFSGKKYVDTIFANITWDKNIEVFGNTYVQPTLTLTISNGATVIIDAGDTLFVDGTLLLDETNGNITINRGGVIKVRQSGKINIKKPLGGGWNLVCVPDSIANLSKASVYPTAISPAWSYVTGSGYVSQDPLTYGSGYWVNFPSNPAPMTYSGHPILAESIAVNAGWNIIGSLSIPLPVNKIKLSPSGNSLMSKYYSYPPTNSSPADTLQPGNAYWVKVQSNGKIILQDTSTANTTQSTSTERPPAAPSLQSTDSLVTATNSQRKLARGAWGKLYFVYNSGGDILYTMSKDSGKTWSAGSVLSNGLTNCTHPSITERNGALYVVFQRDSATYNIAYNYSLDSGNTWLSTPYNLTTGLTTPSPGPIPVILAGTPGNSFEMMIAYRGGSNLQSARTTTTNPSPGNWTTITVNNTNSNSKNPTLGYVSNSYGYYQIAWDEVSKIYREAFYGSSWSSQVWINSGTYGIVTSESYPSIAVTGSTNDAHIAWQGVYSGRGIIVTDKNYATVYTSFTNLTNGYFKPVLTGNNSGRATLLWYDNQSSSQINKATYNGSTWASSTLFGANDKSPTVSLNNPPGGTAFAFWTEGSSSPYAIVTSSNGGPLQKVAVPSTSYERSILIASLDTSVKASVNVTAPVLQTSDGNQVMLSFPTMNDTSSYSADNAWSVLETVPFTLPRGITQATILATRTITSKGKSFSLPISFNIIDVSSGAVIGGDSVQVSPSSTMNQTVDQMILPFHSTSGRQLKLRVIPATNLGGNYVAAVMNIITQNSSGGLFKGGVFGNGLTIKPSDFALQPSYPNPFNPTTTIEYRLRESGLVKLSIFNVLGQEVKSLVDEMQEAGYKTVTLDGNNMSSGVYYARLFVTDSYGKQLFVATEKLLLVK